MTPVLGIVSQSVSEFEVQFALSAVREALVDGSGVTAATEAHVQNSLHALRSTSPYSEAVKDLEAVAVHLRLASEAKRAGHCNLHASQLNRLRKKVFA